MAQSADFRPDINALRALAVLAVVAYHFGLPGAAGGFVGVDVFFVISGYLIGGHVLAALGAGRFSLRAFWTARVRRIVPALVVVLVACWAWGWWHTLPYDYLKTSRHAVAALVFVSNLAFTGELGYFDAAAHTKPLLHTWSLAVEGQFYLVLPILLVLGWRWLKNRVYGMLAVLWMLSFLGCLSGAQRGHPDDFYVLAPRAWELLTGVLLTGAPGWAGRRGAGALGWGGLGAVLFSVAGGVQPAHWPGGWTLLPVLGVAALIAAGPQAGMRLLWANRPAQHLGDISYSLYLWHWPVWVYAQGALPREQPVVQAGLLTLAWLLGWLSWRWVEQPTRRRGTWWQPWRLWLGWGLALLAALAFGGWVVQTHGAPQRLPDAVRRAADVVFVSTPRDACFRRADGSKDAPEPFCRFGADNVAPDMVLWGDSHANQYLTPLSRAATALRRGGWIATHSGCRAMPPGQSTGLAGAAGQACDAFNQQMTTWLDAHPEVHTLVLGRLWGDAHSATDTLALVRHWVGQGRRVVLIGPLPQPGLDVPQAYAQALWHTGQGLTPLPWAGQAAALGLHQRLREELAPWATRGLVVLIDPMARLCDGALGCPLARDGVPVYRDTSHLAEVTSGVFEPDFAAALTALAR